MYLFFRFDCSWLVLAVVDWYWLMCVDVGCWADNREIVPPCLHHILSVVVRVHSQLKLWAPRRGWHFSGKVKKPWQILEKSNRTKVAYFSTHYDFVVCDWLCVPESAHQGNLRFPSKLKFSTKFQFHTNDDNTFHLHNWWVIFSRNTDKYLIYGITM